MPELTPYQKALLAPQPVSVKRRIFRWGVTVFAALLSVGFYVELQGMLADHLAVWLTVCAVVYVVINWLAVLVAAALRWAIFQSGRVLEGTQGHFDHPQARTLHIEARASLESLLKKSNIYHTYSWSVQSVLDVLADWLLFALLVTTNRPVLAAVHAATVLSLYLLLVSIRRAIRKVVATLDEPPSAPVTDAQRQATPSSYTIAAIVYEELRVLSLMDGPGFLQHFPKRWKEISAADQARWEKAIRLGVARAGLTDDPEVLRASGMGLILDVRRQSADSSPES